MLFKHPVLQALCVCLPDRELLLSSIKGIVAVPVFGAESQSAADLSWLKVQYKIRGVTL